MTYPGYEHVKWEAVVQKMEHERLFSFTWPHPKSFDKANYPQDLSGEPTTLVEFRLEKIAGGTLLLLTESGYETSFPTTAVSKRSAETMAAGITK